MHTNATHSPHATKHSDHIQQRTISPTTFLLHTSVCIRFLRCFSACIAWDTHVAKLPEPSSRWNGQGRGVSFVGGYCVINSLSLYFLITTNSLILGRPRPKRYVMSSSRVELYSPMIAQARRHAYGSHTLTQSIESCPYLYVYQAVPI